MQRSEITVPSAVGICDLSDDDLDVVAAGSLYGASRVSQGSFGNIALAVQINNEVNVAAFSPGASQGGGQSNLNNSGSLVAFFGTFG